VNELACPAVNVVVFALVNAGGTPFTRVSEKTPVWAVPRQEPGGIRTVNWRPETGTALELMFRKTPRTELEGLMGESL
jgi:hypothetical protein